MENLTLFSAPIKIYGAGHHLLGGLKVVKTTESFNNLEDLDCQNEENKESCDTRKHLENIIARCHCLPHQLIQANPQVRTSVILFPDRSIQVSICSPSQLGCVDQVPSQYSSCLPACQGVFITELFTENYRDLKKIQGIIHSYEELKRKGQENVSFPLVLKGIYYEN